VILHNKLEQSTAIHFHGLELPNDVDGVPFITQPPVKPGASYTYEFTVPEGNFGSHMYHSHHNAAQQVGLGLLGAFLVEPRNPSEFERSDVDYTLIPERRGAWIHFQRKELPRDRATHREGGAEASHSLHETSGMMVHPMHRARA
jgi:FtsP/CotA-like multicopper oxidase with cupredoxin domain